MSRRDPGLPTGVRRSVYLFKLDGRVHALRLMVFRDDADLAGFNGFRIRGEPVRGVFAQGYRFARVGKDRRLMGEVHLSPAEADLEVVCTATFRLFDFLRRNQHGSEGDCAATAGHLAATICDELQSIGVVVPAIKDHLDGVTRVEEAVAGGRRLLFVFGMGSPRYSLRLLLDDEPACCDPLARSEQPWTFTHIRLRSRDASVATVVPVVYQAFALLRRVDETAYRTYGANAAGQLVAAVCGHLRDQGYSVPSAIGAPAVLRLKDDKWTPLA